MMTTKTAKRQQAARYAMNTETRELYVATSSADWQAALTMWREQRAARRYSESLAAVPSPMPAGHIMFDRRRNGSVHVVLDSLPVPLWTDGVESFYAGQRVHWQRIDRQWAAGELLELETSPEGEPLFLVRADNGLVIIPLALLAV